MNWSLHSCSFRFEERCFANRERALSSAEIIFSAPLRAGRRLSFPLARKTAHQSFVISQLQSRRFACAMHRIAQRKSINIRSWRIRQTVIGDVYMKHPNDPVSLELVAEWDGDVNTAYRFPPSRHYVSRFDGRPCSGKDAWRAAGGIFNPVL